MTTEQRKPYQARDRRGRQTGEEEGVSGREPAVVVDEAPKHRAGNDLALAWIRVRRLRRHMLQGLMGPAAVVKCVVVKWA